MEQSVTVNKLLELTECKGEPLGLVIVDNGYTQRVEANQTQHSPVEALGLDQMADGEAYPLFFPSKVRGALVLTLQAGSGERRPWGGSWSKTYTM